MAELIVRKEGIYRKVVCSLTKNDVELFYDCLGCKYFKDTNKNGDIICSYPE